MYQLESMPFPIKIDLSRDSLFDKAGLFKFKKDYLNTSLNETSPQHRYAYIASVFASDQDHAQRLYEYLSKHWISAATPILQYDAVDKSGLPASCFLSFTEDTKEGLLHNLIETACMSMSGGGIGHIADTRSADGKSTGKMPHIKVANSMVDAYKQKKRRGAFASYCNIDDNEIEQFIELRNPSRKSSSDSERAFNLHHAVNITDEFIEAVLEKKDIWLKCRKTGHKTKQINAYELLMRVIEARALHGEPYIHFIDNSNKRLPDYQKKAGLEVNQSNLCCVSSDMIADTEDGDFPVKDLVGKGAKYWDPDSQTYITPAVDMQLIALSAPIYEITAVDKKGKEHRIKVTADHKHSIYYRRKENLEPVWIINEEHPEGLWNYPLITTLDLIDFIDPWAGFPKNELYIESSYSNGDIVFSGVASDELTIYKSFNRIKSIELLEQKEDVFCLNMGTQRSVWSCNGFVTGNSEIILPTNKDRTAVCFLSSFNLAYFDDWKKDNYIIKDTVEMIDNAITVFIDTLQREYDLFFETRDRKYIRGFALEKALFSAKAERAMGLGTMGYHQYLQKKGLPFNSSFQTVGITRSIYKHIKDRADEATHALAVEKGACPDAAEYGVMVRNSRTLSLAPNASSSILCGNTSPSIEPWCANVFNQVTQTGTVTKLNPELENLIRVKFRDKENPIEGKWAKTDDEDELVRKVTATVGRDRGSVQNLSLLTDKEKEVFKTALEINQTDLIRLAAHRQEFIDQTQSLNLFYDSSKTPLAQMLHDVLLAHSLGVCTLYYNRGVQSEKRDKVGEKIQKVDLLSLMSGASPKFDDSNNSEQIDVVISSVDDCMACEG